MDNFESDYPFGDFLGDSMFDELSDYLQSYCHNKNAVNSMSEGNIPMHALVFCCVCDTKSLRTIFRNIFTSLSNGMRYGKTLSHWFSKI